MEIDKHEIEKIINHFINHKNTIDFINRVDAKSK